MRPMIIFKATIATRRTLAEDLRLIGDPSRALFGRLRWLAGVYALRLTESDSKCSRGTLTTPDRRHARRRQQRAQQPIRGDQRGACTARWTRMWASERRLRRIAPGAARRRLLRQRRCPDPFPGRTNHMIGGNLSWTRNRGRRASSTPRSPAATREAASTSVRESCPSNANLVPSRCGVPRPA
jgi:hypothetical protein